MATIMSLGGDLDGTPALLVGNELCGSPAGGVLCGTPAGGDVAVICLGGWQ